MTSQTNWMKIILITILLIIIGNLVYLDYQIIGSKDTTTSKIVSEEESYPDNEYSTKTTTTEMIKNSTELDYAEFYDAIEDATASLTKKVDALVNSSPITTNKTTSESQTSSTVKEFYIPLGNGSTNSTNWVDLSGVEAYVAPLNYGKIKEMYFEASLRIPTGNGKVHARLKNVSDNNPLIESEVSREGSVGSLVSSGKIPVPLSTKLYRVQLKSSIGADVVLDNARIKIFVE